MPISPVRYVAGAIRSSYDPAWPGKTAGIITAKKTARK